MAKKEAKTDLWVHGLLTDAGVKLEPQGSSIFEINENDLLIKLSETDSVRIQDWFVNPSNKIENIIFNVDKFRSFIK